MKRKANFIKGFNILDKSVGILGSGDCSSQESTLQLDSIAPVMDLTVQATSCGKDACSDMAAIQGFQVPVKHPLPATALSPAPVTATTTKAAIPTVPSLNIMSTSRQCYSIAIMVRGSITNVSILFYLLVCVKSLLYV
jgi:hypothetical protein